MKRRKPVLRGDRYGRLLVLESQPDKVSYAKVACRCDCGKLVEVRVSHLSDGFTKSCGCRIREVAKARGVKPVMAIAAIDAKRIQGSNVSHIQPKAKANRNSTSGVRGVYTAKNGHWRAAITLRGKQIWLGVFNTIEEAAKVRREAEEKYYRPVIEEWEKRQEER